MKKLAIIAAMLGAFSTSAFAQNLPPSIPQLHPASGNILCPSGFGGGVGNPNHVLTWADQAQCWTNDVQLWESFDPSALLSVTLSGTPNTGDVEVLTFHFNATTFSAQYTVQGGDTLTKIASCFVNSNNSGCPGTGNVGIQNIAGLFNNTAGSQGQILYVVNTGAAINLDFNAAVSMYMSFTSTGSRLSVVYGGTNGTQACTVGSPCGLGLDNNPVQQIVRCATTGASPPCVVPGPGSIIWAQTIIGASSTGNADTSYATVAASIQNSTAGSTLGRWIFSTKNPSGADALEIGSGICTANYPCVGLDSFNTGFFKSANGVANAGFYLSGVAGNADASLQEGAAGSVFLNMGSANTFFVRDHANNPMIGVTGVGTAGQGLTYTGASTFAASSLNSVVPITLGTPGSVAGSLVLNNATSGATTIVPATGALNNTTLTAPNASTNDTLVARATTDILTNKTINSGSNTITGTGASNTTYLRGDGTWVTPPGGGAMTYLCTITASNSSSINNASPTSGTCPINSTYTSYLLVFQNIVPATNEKILSLQIHSASGGASYKTTGYIANNSIFISNTVNGGVSTTYIPLTIPSDALPASISNTAPGFSGTVTITTPSASALCMINSNGAYLDGAGGAVNSSSSGYWNTAAAVDGFQVSMDGGSGGNITSGSILVYGIQ